MNISGAFHFRPLGITFVISFLLLSLAACGGGSGGESSDDSQASSSGSVPSSDEACEAFAGAGGFGGIGGLAGGLANFSPNVQGGPSVDAKYSKDAPSDESGKIAEFFEDALEEALGSGVSAECYWEVSATGGDDDGRMVWISLQLPGEVSSDEVKKIQDALADKGATVGGFFGSQAVGSGAMIMVSDLPLDLEGDSGGMLMITDEFAILMAGQDFGGGDSQPASQPSQGNTASEPSSTHPSVDSDVIIERFEKDLEDALGVDLEVESNFTSSTGGENSVVITFGFPEGRSLPSDITDSFEDVAKSSNATIMSTMTIAGMSVVGFEDMDIEGAKATGSITFSEAQNNILVTLQY